ncbi:MAG TPA: hypothetical protein VGL08_11135 [Paraburkholderia sp.]|jgi:hypothetical protein
MLLDIFRRFASHLVRSGHSVQHSPDRNDLHIKPESASPDYQIHPVDPVWHGDHWQNLLSSPMDARHYVMEDWSASPAFELAPTVAGRRS